MANDVGRSAGADGLSQVEPEEVSALRASIPSASDWVSLHEGLVSQFISQAVLRAHRQIGFWPDDVLERLRHASSVATHVCLALEDLATRIAEAETEAETLADAPAQTGAAVGESAGPKDDAQPTQSEASNG